MKIQESAENYLEAILILRRRKGTVRSIDIANELDQKYGAKTAAGLVREAAEVYEKRGRLKKF